MIAESVVSPRSASAKQVLDDMITPPALGSVERSGVEFCKLLD